MKKNCYELSLELLSLSDYLEELIDKKSKTRKYDEDKFLDEEITRTELKFFKIKELLESIEVQ